MSVARHDIVSGLTETAYQHILRTLAEGRLRPGDILDRTAIAKELGVSLAPVGKALTRLERDGFLDILPRRMTKVRVVRREDFRASVLLRCALECQAARIYCGEPVERHRIRLLALAGSVDNSERTPLAPYWEGEIAFHRALVELTECPGFLAEYDRIMQIGLFVLVGGFSVANPFPPAPYDGWHTHLVEKIGASQPDAAEHLMREHLEYGREAFLRQAK